MNRRNRGRKKKGKKRKGWFTLLINVSHFSRLQHYRRFNPVIEEDQSDQRVAKFPARRLPVSAEFRQRSRSSRGQFFVAESGSEVIEPLNVPSAGFTAGAHCYSTNELNASSVIEELSEDHEKLNNRISNGGGDKII